MYDVVVNARLTLEAYALNRNADTGARPLYSTLQSLDGWNADVGAWENGYAITAAGADNIQLVTAPSYRDDWELVGENVLTINAGGLSGISFDDWYKVTTTYTAAVKYDGMTLAACRSLYGSLNNGSTGWYLSSNPWVLSAYRQGETFKLDWVQDKNAVIYQCLNRATMQRTGGKMWSVELQLEARTEAMKKSGSTVTHTWPGLWQRIPAIQRFL
jgi:hypothetical protein